MKKLLALTLCLVLALGICSAFAEDQLTLRVAWWGGQERHNATIAALDEYAKANGITINYEYTSWGSYFENLATQSVGNNLPDVIQMSTTDIINYAENGKLIDLTPYVEDGIIDLTYIEESSLSGGKVGDMLAGFTTGTNTVSVVYNQELFDAAGVDYPTADWTWSEFIDDAKTIYEATGAQTEIPFIEEARWVVEAMVRSFGYDFFSADGESLPWAEDEAVVNAVVAAIQDVQDGIKAGYFVDPEVQIAWITTEDTYIAQGKSAMSFRLSNYYPMYCNVIGRELGVAMLPRLDDGSQSGMYLNSNMYWTISVNSENPEEAAKVLNYLINDTSACLLIGTDRGVSLSSAVRDTLANNENTDAYNQRVLNYISEVNGVVSAVNPADPINSAELIAVLKADYVAVCYGQMSPEDCVNHFIEQSSKILPR